MRPTETDKAPTISATPAKGPAGMGRPPTTDVQ